MEPQQDSSIGNQLKEEREKQGLSRQQVAEITKLRIHVIEALENEDWFSLPSQVFVKGFIRSYAQVLGLDWKRAVTLYKRVAPSENEDPKPLVRTDSVKKQNSLCVLGILAVLAVIIVLWASYKDQNIRGRSVPTDLETAAAPQHATEEKGEVSDMKAAAEPVAPSEDHQDVAPPRDELEPVRKQAVTEAVLETDTEDMEESIAPNAEAFVPDEEAGTAYNEPLFESAVTDMHVLKGFVSMGTWVKIYVDDQPAKEYMFKPGSMPQWEAGKGFDLLVGNAAGIEFDFDGNRVAVSGGPGRVRRVRFPEDFESSFYEE